MWVIKKHVKTDFGEEVFIPACSKTKKKLIDYLKNQGYKGKDFAKYNKNNVLIEWCEIIYVGEVK